MSLRKPTQHQTNKKGKIKNIIKKKQKRREKEKVYWKSKRQRKDVSQPPSSDVILINISSAGNLTNFIFHFSAVKRTVTIQHDIASGQS